MTYPYQQDPAESKRAMWMAFIGVLAVAFFLFGTILWVNLDDNDRSIQAQADMIAACSASDDVVGCLEALK